MNKNTGLFFGAFLLFGTSWLGLVAYPYLTFAGLRQSKDDATGALAPKEILGQLPKGLGSMRRMAVFIVTASISERRTKGMILIANGAPDAPWPGITCSTNKSFWELPDLVQT